MLVCRLSVVLAFFAWAYDKLKVGFALHGDGVSDVVMKNFYYLNLPSVFFAIIGIAHFVAVVMVAMSVFKCPTRFYLLALSLVPFLAPALLGRVVQCYRRCASSNDLVLFRDRACCMCIHDLCPA